MIDVYYSSKADLFRWKKENRTIIKMKICSLFFIRREREEDEERQSQMRENKENFGKFTIHNSN